MERRKKSRFEISKRITLKVLDRWAGPSLGKCIEGHVTDISGSGLRLRLPMPVPCGVTVEIADQHTVILGEVCRCVPDGDAYTAGVRMRETLAAGEPHAHGHRQGAAHTRS